METLEKLTTDERERFYRRFRADDPYMTARVAWSLAGSAAAGREAGVVSWANADGVTIGGRDYLLTVVPDDGGSPWDGDCFGEVIDRGETVWGEPEPLEWPVVALPAGSDGVYPSSYRGEGETCYDPGPSWEPYAPKGMARGLVREYLRGVLVREGLMIRDSSEVGVILTDADDPTLSASLWAVGLGQEMIPALAYLSEVVFELADEVEGDREARWVAEMERLHAFAAHG